MVGFVLSGLCICLQLSMGLRPFCLHLKVCGSFGPLSDRVVWSRRQPLAGVGAVLSLLDWAHWV